MLCQNFLFLSKHNSNRLLQSDANNYSVIRSAKQHGLEGKLSGFPGLTAKMMQPGAKSQAIF